jgi:hypothetical protein
MWPWRRSSLLPTFRVRETIFTAVQTQENLFRGCGLWFYNTLVEANNFGFDASLLSVLLSFRATLPEIEPRKDFFRDGNLCFRNVFFETNKFVLCAVILFYKVRNINEWGLLYQTEPLVIFLSYMTFSHSSSYILNSNVYNTLQLGLFLPCRPFIVNDPRHL